MLPVTPGLGGNIHERLSALFSIGFATAATLGSLFATRAVEGQQDANVQTVLINWRSANAVTVPTLRRGKSARIAITDGPFASTLVPGLHGGIPSGAAAPEPQDTTVASGDDTLSRTRNEADSLRALVGQYQTELEALRSKVASSEPLQRALPAAEAELRHLQWATAYWAAVQSNREARLKDALDAFKRDICGSRKPSGATLARLWNGASGPGQRMLILR